MYRATHLFSGFIVYVIVITKPSTAGLLGDDETTTTSEPVEIGTLSYNEWCKFQPNTFDCGEKGVRSLNRYYYDLKMEDCVQTTSGDCKDNHNVFSNIARCREACLGPGPKPVIANLTKNVICRFQPDFGACHDYKPLWYFDVSSKTCRGFSYSGCGGNEHRFKSANDCTAECLTQVEYVLAE